MPPGQHPSSPNEGWLKITGYSHYFYDDRKVTKYLPALSYSRQYYNRRLHGLPLDPTPITYRDKGIPANRIHKSHEMIAVLISTIQRIKSQRKQLGLSHIPCFVGHKGGHEGLWIETAKREVKLAAGDFAVFDHAIVNHCQPVTFIDRNMIPMRHWPQLKCDLHSDEAGTQKNSKMMQRIHVMQARGDNPVGQQNAHCPQAEVDWVQLSSFYEVQGKAYAALHNIRPKNEHTAASVAARTEPKPPTPAEEIAELEKNIKAEEQQILLSNRQIITKQKLFNDLSDQYTNDTKPIRDEIQELQKIDAEKEKLRLDKEKECHDLTNTRKHEGSQLSVQHISNKRDLHQRFNVEKHESNEELDRALRKARQDYKRLKRRLEEEGRLRAEDIETRRTAALTELEDDLRDLLGQNDAHYQQLENNVRSQLLREMSTYGISSSERLAELRQTLATRRDIHRITLRDIREMISMNEKSKADAERNILDMTWRISDLKGEGEGDNEFDTDTCGDSELSQSQSEHSQTR